MQGIITICGSTKFKEQYEVANRELTLADWIVLNVGTYMHCIEDWQLRQRVFNSKEQLDRLHKEKIAISQAILVIDVDGYIGESTKSEIEYAQKLQKKIYYWSESMKLGGIKPMLEQR